MQCLKCNGTQFTAKLIIVNIKGIEKKCPAWVCNNCHENLMDSRQMDTCLKKVKRPMLTLAEREKEKIRKANEKWVLKNPERPTNQSHPWKKNYYNSDTPF